MTMTTSTLQNNALFEHMSFSSRAYPGRPASNKLNENNDSSHSGTNFGHNIWQSNWQSDLEKSFDHVVKDKGTYSRLHEDAQLNVLPGNRRPQPPSLALPNIKANVQLFGNGIDRRSPIGSERGTTRESEPHSARSRSQHESSSLTPTSFSNDSEFSAMPTTSNLDQRRTNDPFNVALVRDRTNIWPNAPEFQPSLSIQQQDLIRRQVREQPRNGIVGGSKPLFSASSDNGLGNIWNSREKDSFSCERNEFRPVLSANTNLGSTNENQDRSFFSTINGTHDLSASFARLTTDGDTRQKAFNHADLHSSMSGGTMYTPSNLQGRQYISQRISDPWSEKTYMHNQNLQIEGSKPSRSNIDTSRLTAMNNIDFTSTTQHRMPQKSLQSSYSNDLPQSSSMLYRQQINEFRPAESQLHPSQMYDAKFFCPDVNSGGAIDYKGYNYSFDPSLGNTYMPYNPATRHQPESAQLTRSPLLEEFRIHGRTKKYELKDIFGHIVEFSGDQLGSRFIQHKLEVANSEEKDRVFSEISSDCRQLMTDLFGNYVIQKLFEHGNQSQKKVLASQMKGHMMALSTQAYGCRVVQKALDHILTEQQASLIKELDGHVLKVVENQNGNHVIQKAIERIPGEHIQFIMDAHRGHVHALSKHAYGCRVIQRMLEHCEPRAKRAVLDELHVNIGELIQDPFGNYVVQHVIVNGEPQDRRPVIDKVQSRLLENAMHKFASNVVEKALDYAEEDQSRAMLQKLTSRDEQGQSQIIKLLSHQYGNYVIQKSSGHLNGHALHALLDEMEQYLTQLRRVSTGKQTAALETSIRDARQRLHAQRQQTMIPNAPTEPGRHTMVRR